MNRLIKWSVILGIMVSLVGIGVITAGAMMGGGYYLEWVLREAVREGWVLRRLGGVRGKGKSGRDI